MTAVTPRLLACLVAVGLVVLLPACGQPARPYGLPPGHENRPLVRAGWTRTETAAGVPVYSRTGTPCFTRAWMPTCDPDGRLVWVELSPDMIRDLYELGVGWRKE